MTAPIDKLTTKQVAAELQVHPNTVYKLYRQRLLRRVKVGRLNRVLRTDLDRYLSRQTR